MSVTKMAIWHSIQIIEKIWQTFFWFHDDSSVIVSWSSQRYAVIYNVPPVLWIKNLIHYVAWSHFPIFTRPQSCKWLSFQPYSLSWQEQWFLSTLVDNQQEINVLVLYELIADSMTTKNLELKLAFFHPNLWKVLCVVSSVV